MHRMHEKFRKARQRVVHSVRRHLPQRRILIQSPDGDRSIIIGTRGQLMGIATSAMIAGWLTISTASMVAPGEAGNQRTQAELARMTAQVQALKADTEALKGNVATAAERIESRQKFLDALLTGRGKTMAANGVELTDLLPPSGAANTDTAVSGVLAPFAALEARQSALVDRAAASAQTRIKDAESLISRLGLKPSRFIAQSVGHMTRTGMGGPFISQDSDSADNHGADPDFAELFVNWQRVEQLEAAMKAIPAYVPVRNYTLTSNYGTRYDPFNGGRANHAGLDMAGVTGEPIMAGAAGKVVRAARFGAYGNTIDIDHGKGILTRYAHLSRIDVRVGDKVAMGQKIGALGSTGRSTGPHLHYEVRIDGRPVNPRLFLEASSYILAYQKEVAGPQLSEF